MSDSVYLLCTSTPEEMEKIETNFEQLLAYKRLTHLACMYIHWPNGNTSY